MTMVQRILFSSVLLSALLNTNKVAEADNILLLSWPLFSHVQALASMARELSKFSHTSYLPITEDLVGSFKTYKGVKVMHMKSDPNLLTFTDMGMRLLYKDSNVTFKQLQDIMDVICDNLLLDEDWFQSLKAINATIAVVDYVFMSNCLAIIPYKLSIPYVFQGINFEHYAISRTPWLPSTFPHLALINTDQMNFYDRLENSFITMSSYFKRLNGAPLKSVKTYAPEKPDITFVRLMQQADLYLIETDTVLEYPFPTLPNVVYIGGISTRPASALKGDLRKFVDESSHGIIVVSFGSFLEELPKEIIAKMELAF